MRTTTLVAAVVLGLLGVVYGLVQRTTVAPGDVEVYFSPRGGCQEAIVSAIDAARSVVHVQAYSFTSSPIAEALLRARNRGVAVEVVMDEGQLKEGYSEIVFFYNQKVPVFTDGLHAIAHNKVMIVDGQIVITGSFNFTKSAEDSNAENLLILHSPDLAARYEQNYQHHLAHSIKYEGRPEHAKPAAEPHASPRHHPG
jgi:phosphatidylserine/phosphatidylglycerophosphate/cardiolipin synthase-like enzyme